MGRCGSGVGTLTRRWHRSATHAASPQHAGCTWRCCQGASLALASAESPPRRTRPRRTHLGAVLAQCDDLVAEVEDVGHIVLADLSAHAHHGCGWGGAGRAGEAGQHASGQQEACTGLAWHSKAWAEAAQPAVPARPPRLRHPPSIAALRTHPPP